MRGRLAPMRGLSKKNRCAPPPRGTPGKTSLRTPTTCLVPVAIGDGLGDSVRPAAAARHE